MVLPLLQQVLQFLEMVSMGLDVPAQWEVIQPILRGSAHRREMLIARQKAHLSAHAVIVPQSQDMGPSDQSYGEIYWSAFYSYKPLSPELSQG